MFELVEKNNFWEGTPVKTGYRRERYLDRLTRYLDNALVKVITGARRSGKSFILRGLIDHLIRVRQVPSANILYLNLDLTDLSSITDAEKLVAVIREYEKRLAPRGRVYLCIDEVQEIEGWERVVNSFSQDHTRDYELFITGSNARLLSQELGTYLTGRYVPVEVLPFSYGEYLAFLGLKRGKESFIGYLRTGGLPEMLAIADLELRAGYIAALRDSIILRDIVRRHAVRDPYLLELLVRFLTDSVGSPVSPKAIIDYLRSAGHQTNVPTVGAYLTYIAEAYFAHDCPRWDIRGKRLLSGEKKWYLNDLGFKSYLAPATVGDFGRYLENAIYLHLRGQGATVRTGRIGDREIDFIAERSGVPQYVQVAYLLADDQVIAREFGNLDAIPDNYEKVVVTLDDVAMGDRNGVRHVQAWEFVE